MTKSSKRPLKITYLVKGARSLRLADPESPSELLYGYRELQGLGPKLTMLEDKEFGLDKEPRLFVRLFNDVLYRLTGIPGWALWKLYEKRKKFAGTDVVVVSTNTFGVCLGVLYKLRFVKANIVFLAMGLVEDSTPKRWKVTYRWALGQAGVVALAKADAVVLSHVLRREVAYIPFGVDYSFWAATDEVSAVAEVEEPYFFSIGNDRHRDYNSLIKAWKPWFPKLLIVTKLPVSPVPENVEVVQGDWHNQALSDNEIRHLIKNAIATILPIKKTVQPSGQSAALQSMACGQTVLITDFPGLWNRELMIDGKTCVFIGKPGQINVISDVVDLVLKNRALLEQIGQQGKGVVQSKLTCQSMAEGLLEFIIVKFGC
jgi:glycosyltransferase involved in cell wall biosynthesis